MSKFDTLYPEAKHGTEIDFEGSTLFIAKCDNDKDYTDLCWHCGEPTRWLDISFSAPLCSEECERAKWSEFLYDGGLKDRIEKAILNKALHQADIIPLYQTCVVCYKQGARNINFSKINRLIIERWSFSGLEKIKKGAWKGLEPVTMQVIE